MNPTLIHTKTGLSELKLFFCPFPYHPRSTGHGHSRSGRSGLVGIFRTGYIVQKGECGPWLS